MKKTVLLSALFALLLGACRSLHVSDFHTTQAIPQRLPSLGLLVHERSFADAFYAALDHDMQFRYTYIPDPWEVYGKTDQSMNDVFHALDNELFDNVNVSDKERYGHARFKLLYYQRRNSGWGWIIPSVATFWTANLLGMPCSVIRIDLELQMEITDAHGKVLGQYKAPGMGKGKIAAYHGYDGLTAVRKANLVAIQNAFSTIKTNLATDIPTLSEQLKAAGTVHPLDRK
ncbi:MAG TPA: hypothetical protein PLO67_18385 [Saprospiraceae bacterium]|mgnify:CR=1 FL=1|nr:hypothetical protein [Saprospiraceae bacterium]HPI07961.1 hypothetical protein [Saprospiraceae bacterium]